MSPAWPSPAPFTDLKSLVQSFHSAIAIETVEEERVDALLDAVAAELGFPVFEWTVTRGLVQRPTAHANLNTKEALGALGHMRGLSLEAIFLMKDFARHLNDPAVCREFSRRREPVLVHPLDDRHHRNRPRRDPGRRRFAHPPLRARDARQAGARRGRGERDPLAEGAPRGELRALEAGPRPAARRARRHDEQPGPPGRRGRGGA